MHGSTDGLFLSLSSPFLLLERPEEGAAPGCPADLRRGDGISAEDVPEHGGLRGGAGGCPDGGQHPGGRLVLGSGSRAGCSLLSLTLQCPINPPCSVPASPQGVLLTAQLAPSVTEALSLLDYSGLCFLNE